MSRPNAVTDAEICRQGSLPTVAPVNPYTELAEIWHSARHRWPQPHPRPDVPGPTHLECQLAAVQDGAAEGVRFLLQIGLGPLACRQQVLQNLGQEPLAHRALDKQV
jgi:hypothetical protein